ncbi:zinc metalloproteinase/disintegrin-like [Gigantopelta aegis]|uniref:zinc metalloproteinase/disintegrin-like n=1 Tax=Gigantopelta aegis TaxID=1735272 RepID=UPI001B88D7A7|nr:zinc metalloproteinase/disintegrin-like [Gigantopelta aegis]
MAVLLQKRHLTDMTDLLLACFLLTAPSLVIGRNVGDAEVVVVKEIKKRQTTGYPESLHFVLHTKSSSINLRLKRNNPDNENADVFVIKLGKDGKPELVKAGVDKTKETATYRDRAVGGLFNVYNDCIKGLRSTCQRSLWGIMYVDGEPCELSRMDADGRKRNDDSGTSGQYLLKRRTTVGASLYASVLTDRLSEDETKRDTSQWIVNEEKNTYGIELVMIADYALYKDLSKHNASLTPQRQRLENINRVRSHLSNIVNGMDLRYNGIDDPNMFIYVRSVAYAIMEEPWMSQFTEGKPQGEGRRAVADALKSLSEFTKWIHEAEGVPSFDHAMCVTGNDIAYKGDTATLGIAYVKAICKRDRTSLIEYHRNLMGAVETATHELGHNLGAAHDGENNNCESSSQYIMASFVGRRHDQIKLNPWKFSPCSVNYFKKSLSNIKKHGENCLENTAKTGNPAEYRYHTSRLPGQIYSADEQCKFIKGQESHFCSWLIRPEEVCTRLACLMPGPHYLETKCQVYSAARGTSCGHRKRNHQLVMLLTLSVARLHQSLGDVLFLVSVVH